MPEPNKGAPDADAAAEDAAAPEMVDVDMSEQKSGRLRMLLTVAAVAVLPAALGAYLTYSQYPHLAEAAAATAVEFGFGEAAGKEKPVEYGTFTTISELLINPADTGGKGFLVVSLGLETKSSDVIAEIEDKEIVVRDAILRLLSEHTREELASIELRSTLKNKILLELNRILTRGEIDRLYFTQYLLQ